MGLELGIVRNDRMYREFKVTELSETTNGSLKLLSALDASAVGVSYKDGVKTIKMDAKRNTALMSKIMDIAALTGVSTLTIENSEWAGFLN